jgi:hypothetical protein
VFSHNHGIPAADTVCPSNGLLGGAEPDSAGATGAWHAASIATPNAVPDNRRNSLRLTLADIFILLVKNVIVTTEGKAVDTNEVIVMNRYSDTDWPAK